MEYAKLLDVYTQIYSRLEQEASRFNIIDVTSLVDNMNVEEAARKKEIVKIAAAYAAEKEYDEVWLLHDMDRKRFYIVPSVNDYMLYSLLKYNKTPKEVKAVRIDIEVETAREIGKFSFRWAKEVGKRKRIYKDKLLAFMDYWVDALEKNPKVEAFMLVYINDWWIPGINLSELPHVSSYACRNLGEVVEALRATYGWRLPEPEWVYMVADTIAKRVFRDPRFKGMKNFVDGHELDSKKLVLIKYEAVGTAFILVYILR